MEGFTTQSQEPKEVLFDQPSWQTERKVVWYHGTWPQDASRRTRQCCICGAGFAVMINERSRRFWGLLQGTRRPLRLSSV